MASKMTRDELEAKIAKQAWKDEKFKKELLANPKAVIEKVGGGVLPAGVQVKVLEENAKTIYFVLPMNPAALSAELSKAQLDQIAGGVQSIKAEEMDIR